MLRGVNEDETSIELLAHIDGSSFVFFFQRLTIDGKLKEEAASFLALKEAICAEFQRKEELDKLFVK